jgi:HNH endonuclease
MTVPDSQIIGSCIEWSGGKNKSGYGRKWHKGRVLLAHRVAWIETHGPIPDGMCVLHRCDVRSCVNVEHLFLGTQADNMRDMAEKGRARSPQQGKTHCPAGHPYDEENTYVHMSERHCRACNRESARRYRSERRAS